MRTLSAKYGKVVFVAIALFFLVQVAWWATVVVRDADLIARLQLANADSAEAIQNISNEALHRKRMFLSESLFFIALTFVGLAILYRALRSERESRETQRGFIDMVSHEAKTPLTALKLRLESLRERVADEDIASSLSLGLEEVRRLSGVLEKAMDLNRSERHALHFEALCFAEVVQSVVRRIEPWLAANDAQVRMDLDPEVFVRGDFASLQNSVQSLLENAVLHNPCAVKQVSLTLLARGRYASLSVVDNGPGVSDADKERVFERFYRGDSGKTVAGSGLGLHLAKTIVEAHQGVLRLAEATRGARFEIELPLGSPV